MPIAIVMAGAVIGLVAVTLALRYKRDAIARMRSSMTARLSTWAKTTADAFDGVMERVSTLPVIGAFVRLAHDLYGSEVDEDWARRRRAQPGLAGVLLAGFVLLVVLGQMNHLLAGMRP